MNALNILISAIVFALLFAVSGIGIAFFAKWAWIVLTGFRGHRHA